MDQLGLNAKIIQNSNLKKPYLIKNGLPMPEMRFSLTTLPVKPHTWAPILIKLEQTKLN